jgi:hypothetical protein
MNRIVTLTTDFGLKDNFVGVVKGVILQKNPEAKIVDITHEISPQSILEAAFVINSAYSFFPSGTLHVVICDPGVGTRRRIIIVSTKKYLFLAPDNGVLSLVIKKEPPQKIINVSNHKFFLTPISSTFHGRDIFAPVAGYLSRGGKLTELGEVIANIKMLPLPQSEYKKNVIKTPVVYIDKFGNIITALSQKDWQEKVKKKNFQLHFEKKKLEISLKRAYADGEQGEIIALFGSSGFLELAINHGNAAQRLQVKTGTLLKIIPGS